MTGWYNIDQVKSNKVEDRRCLSYGNSCGSFGRFALPLLQRGLV
jgi:hypothetical protein